MDDRINPLYLYGFNKRFGLKFSDSYQLFEEECRAQNNQDYISVHSYFLIKKNLWQKKSFNEKEFDNIYIDMYVISASSCKESTKIQFQKQRTRRHVTILTNVLKTNK